MKISRRWLSDFVDFEDLSTEEFSELITTRVAEVDEILSVGVELDKIRIAKVLKVDKIPKKDKLSLAKLSLGDGELEVVCGAPNCKEGMFVAYAAPGSKFIFTSGGEAQLVEVQKRSVGGIESNGLLLSETELGIGADNRGILEITEQLFAEASPQAKASQIELGASLKQYLPGPDCVLEIDNKSLTHRPDLWGHFGFAREISALLNRPLKKDCDIWSDSSKQGQDLLSSLGTGKMETDIQIEDASGCRRFLALNFEGASVMPSPLWMRSRLHSIGAGVRNLLVDLSNYVMHDVGQPNHAYDRDLMGSKRILVRRAKDGEKLNALDETEAELTSEDLVITDGETPVALAGVIGGERSSIQDTTSNLLLESANFDPKLVRVMCKRHGLRTDASNRFEKSLSAYSSPLAIQRFAELLCEIDSNVKITSKVSDCFVEKPRSVSVPVCLPYIRQRLGADISDSEISTILTGLGFDTKDLLDSEGLLGVPYFRATRDISIEDDLVEEVGRIYGYENVPEAAPVIVSSASHPCGLSELKYQLSDLLRGIGFSEVSSYSFMNPRRAEDLGFYESQAIEVKNPVDADLSQIRTTLVPGMLEAVEENLKNFSSLSLFEFGSAYRQIEKAKDKENAAEEKHLLCLAYCSGQDEKKAANVYSPEVSAGADFYSLASVLRKLSASLCLDDLKLEPLEAGQVQAWLHPFRCAKVTIANRELGIIAEVNPMSLDGASQRIVLTEIDMDIFSLFAENSAQFVPISKYPDSFFEMSVVMPSKEPYDSLESLIRKNVDQELLRNLEVVSVYRGKPLEENQKSVSVKLFLGADDRTLSSEQLNAIQEKLVEGVDQSEFSLRS